MNTIALTKGKFAIVDEADFKDMAQFKWYFDAGYATRRIKTENSNKAFRMHQQIMGFKEGYVIDHLNGNGLDNRRENLRFATKSENGHNSTSARGYYWDKQHRKFISRLSVNGKVYRIGRFDTENEAIKAYNDFKISMGFISADRLSVGSKSIKCPNCGHII